LIVHLDLLKKLVVCFAELLNKEQLGGPVGLYPYMYVILISSVYIRGPNATNAPYPKNTTMATRTTVIITFVDVFIESIYKRMVTTGFSALNTREPI